ncbi:hypothetical protein J3A83DRAFT_4185156 [Scleroderma citrinum]
MMKALKHILDFVKCLFSDDILVNKTFGIVASPLFEVLPLREALQPSKWCYSCNPEINVIKDLLCLDLSMNVDQILLNPIHQVILEPALDELMKNICVLQAPYKAFTRVLPAWQDSFSQSSQNQAKSREYNDQ